MPKRTKKGSIEEHPQSYNTEIMSEESLNEEVEDKEEEMKDEMEDETEDEINDETENEMEEKLNEERPKKTSQWEEGQQQEERKKRKRVVRPKRRRSKKGTKIKRIYKQTIQANEIFISSTLEKKINKNQ